MTGAPAIPLRRILDPQGTEVAARPAFAADPRAVVALHRAMLRTRAFDARAVALQRAGQLGTYPSSLGQEATAVGLAAAMRASDVLVPSFREHGAQLWRGVTPLELLLFWGGDERGSDFAAAREDFPVSIPVASHAPHAVGVALAFRIRREERAALCTLGDGATSKGDFYEAINAAGVWRLPLVFVVANNAWAISTPTSRQTAAASLAHKAFAAGIAPERVDGNDVLAVRAACEEALARARAGEGPTLVEALSYRLADHTTSDDAARYRDAAEVERQRAQEPLARTRAWLAREGAWDDAQEAAAHRECEAEMEQAATAWLATPPPEPDAVFSHLYAQLPAPLAAQREAYLGDAARRLGRGDA